MELFVMRRHGFNCGRNWGVGVSRVIVIVKYVVGHGGGEGVVDAEASVLLV